MAVAEKMMTAAHRRKLRAAVWRPDQVKAELCRRDFAYFIREFWDEVSSDTLVWNWHIDVFCEELTQLARDVADHKERDHDLILNVPPGSTKSVSVSIMFPVWCWINWYWMKFIVASYSGSLALEHAEMSRDLVRSEKFQQYFPDLQIKQDKDTKSNFRLQKYDVNKFGKLQGLKQGGSRYSTSVGGTLTGYHGHILIVDDALDPNRSVSEVELDNANRWIDQTLSTRKIDKAVTPTILVMQRLAQNDPTGHILSKKKTNVRHICLPGEIKNYGYAVQPPEYKEKYIEDVLDTNRLNWKILDDVYLDLGQYGYAGQIGQDPVPPGGGMFRIDAFNVIQHTIPQHRIMQIVRYWDKAGSDGSGAYTVGCKMGKLDNGKYIVVDIKRGQWSSDERERIIRSTAEADGTHVTVYHEQEGGSGGKESAEATTRLLAGYKAIADRPTGDKVVRADPYSAQVNSGNVLLLAGEWHHAFLEEHRFFPFSKYKDQVDASAGAFNKLAGKKQVRLLYNK